jgi:hypothetical protein
MLSDYPTQPLNELLKQYIIWSQLQHYQVLGIMTDRFDKVNAIQAKMLELLDSIPEWYLKQREVSRTKRAVEFENGSKILFLHDPIHCKGRTITAMAFDDNANFDHDALSYILPSINMTANSLIRSTA